MKGNYIEGIIWQPPGTFVFLRCSDGKKHGGRQEFFTVYILGQMSPNGRQAIPSIESIIMKQMPSNRQAFHSTHTIKKNKNTWRPLNIFHSLSFMKWKQKLSGCQEFSQDLVQCNKKKIMEETKNFSQVHKCSWKKKLPCVFVSLCFIESFHLVKH